MALAREQAGCGIEPHPAGARKIGFGPRVQVREIGGRPGRSFERLDIGDKLNQIAGHKARGQPEAAHDLDQQPG